MTDEDQINALFATYARAFNAGDAPGCAACYELGGEYIACGMAPARGRGAIAALHAGIFDTEPGALTLTTTQIAVSGDLAYVRQSVSLGGAMSDVMLILRRTQDGGWLVMAEAEVPQA